MQRKLMAVAIAALGAILGSVGCDQSAHAQTLPSDAHDACPLSPTTFAGWFQTGSVTANGFVTPANSLDTLAPDCGFFTWAERMFLWLASPAPSDYGGGAHIFDSPTFYDVSPLYGNGTRILIPHTPGTVHVVLSSVANLGPHALPVVLDRAGQTIEVRPVNRTLRPLVRDRAGDLVEIAHARMANGRPVLLDRENKVIAVRRSDRLTTPPSETQSGTQVVQAFSIDQILIYLDPSPAVIDVEQDQAVDLGVLQAQYAANGSLVYYTMMVNDVFAYFMTGLKHGAITTTTPNQFPTTQADLNEIVAYATAHGRPSPPFPDPNALAIEVKAAWVDATGLPDPGSYITTTATIPTYTKASPYVWNVTGQKTLQLALVGMHVVGSTAGHPEMVWSTFEHVRNTPLASYSYDTTSGGVRHVAPDTSGNWLFSPTGYSGPFNSCHMFLGGSGSIPTTSIVNCPTFTISPSPTDRARPFGVDGSNTSVNTEVISMNNHVLGMLAHGDARGSYVMVGTTWTQSGSAPTIFNQGVGTNRLANTTMETYVQGSNCFGCHMVDSVSPTAKTTSQVSHVLWQGQDLNGQLTGGLKPLF
jgi:hypothetical protein